jgi:uncharacterized membrane protein
MFREYLMSLLVAGLVVFLGIHLVPAFPNLRNGLVARLGEGRYKGLFSLASAAGLALIIAGYALAPSTERVFAPNATAIAWAPFAVTLAFILFAAANMRGYLRHALGHPMLLGLAVWAAVHLLANGDLRGTLLFGAFLAYAVLDLASAISRHAVKSLVPSFKFDIMAIVGGLVVALAVMALHRWLFGVRVVAFGV